MLLVLLVEGIAVFTVQSIISSCFVWGRKRSNKKTRIEKRYLEKIYDATRCIMRLEYGELQWGDKKETEREEEYFEETKVALLRLESYKRNRHMKNIKTNYNLKREKEECDFLNEKVEELKKYERRENFECIEKFCRECEKELQKMAKHAKWF